MAIGVAKRPNTAVAFIWPVREFGSGTVGLGSGDVDAIGIV